MDNDKMTEDEFHKKTAVTTNNEIWSTLDKEKPSDTELEDALHKAHTSLYHWSKIGEPINIARAEYMVSRVCSAFHWAQPALYHAKRCLEITEKTGVGDFDLAFAYEVMTRAHVAAGKQTECKKYRNLAQKAIENIKNQEDRKICQIELDKVSCG